jgi:hypothetical protein
MAPHVDDEASSHVGAFDECSLALKELPNEELDESARSWIATIVRTMDTTGIEDPSGRGIWAIRAEQLSIEEEQEFSRAVDGLANWCDHRFLGDE